MDTTELAVYTLLSSDLGPADVLREEYWGDDCPPEYHFAPSEKLHTAVQSTVAQLKPEELASLIAEIEQFWSGSAWGRHSCHDAFHGVSLKRHDVHNGKTLLEFYACDVLLWAIFRVALQYWRKK